MDREGRVEVYDVWDCGSWVAVCSHAVYAAFDDYCDGAALWAADLEKERRAVYEVMVRPSFV